MTGVAEPDPAARLLAPLLLRLVDYERTRPRSRLWDLANMQAMLARPGAAAPPRPAVQVGGSKGKGTACAFLAGLAQAAGRRPGLYTSPHLETIGERIEVAGARIAPQDLRGLLEPLVDAAEAAGLGLSFFEAMTLAAVEWFAAAGVDLAIWEVGLGGRFDATTALPVDVSVITGIELEHTEVLGSTLEAIAAEKAPVIRPGGRGFTAAGGAALAVIERHAAAVGARLCVLGRDLDYREARWQGMDFRARLRFACGHEQAVFLPDARLYEPTALALAAAALREALPGVDLRLDPAPRPRLPARFEVLRCADGEPLVLDGAHTPGSLAAVAAELGRRFPGRRAAVLFASAAGKRWREGLSALLPVADSFVVTGLTATANEDPASIGSWLSAGGQRCTVAADVPAGLAALSERPGPRLVTGSFYLAGQVRRLLGQQPWNG